MDLVLLVLKGFLWYGLFYAGFVLLVGLCEAWDHFNCYFGPGLFIGGPKRTFHLPCWVCKLRR